MDSKRIVMKGRAIPLRGNDIDTDRIIPARFLKTVTFDGLGDHAFEDDRLGLSAEGKKHPFDEAKFNEATILIVNKNFGCGSSREHAPQAIVRWGKGITIILGESFAEIFYGNCQTLGVPCPTLSAEVADALQSAVEKDPTAEVTVDLQARTVSVGSQTYPVSIPDGPRKSFLEGTWDSTGDLLSAKEAIQKTERSLQYTRRYAP
jgi:3-isopropylmalate/(R)-2-methylmalate dehydratase small subunit